jgi:hypothetical protein
MGFNNSKKWKTTPQELRQSNQSAIEKLVREVLSLHNQDEITITANIRKLAEKYVVKYNGR